MKKSKFLLLGSVASLASIPFVAAKCGETKEEEKKKPEEGKNPGQNTDPGKNPGGDKNPGGNTEPGKNPSENTVPGKNPGGDKNPGSNITPGSNSENSNNQNASTKKSLPAIISNRNQQLGQIKKKDKQSILEALLATNRILDLDKSQLDVRSISSGSAVIFAKSDSVKYEGEILVSFTIDMPDSSGSKNPGTTTQPSDTTKPAKPANNPMVRNRR
uniref:Variable surface lipoprotein Vsp422-2 n=1 Tax=Mycoplasmopsis bovis TaxID=28903 RepID=Q93CL7_MYCBV|nr:variable surface lipoprotein Vsp422-2 [Mycoplasmopsis bovis]